MWCYPSSCFAWSMLFQNEKSTTDSKIPSEAHLWQQLSDFNIEARYRKDCEATYELKDQEPMVIEVIKKLCKHYNCRIRDVDSRASQSHWHLWLYSVEPDEGCIAINIGTKFEKHYALRVCLGSAEEFEQRLTDIDSSRSQQQKRFLEDDVGFQVEK